MWTHPHYSHCTVYIIAAFGGHHDTSQDSKRRRAQQSWCGFSSWKWGEKHEVTSNLYIKRLSVFSVRFWIFLDHVRTTFVCSNPSSTSTARLWSDAISMAVAVCSAGAWICPVGIVRWRKKAHLCGVVIFMVIFHDFSRELVECPQENCCRMAHVGSCETQRIDFPEIDYSKVAKALWWWVVVRLWQGAVFFYRFLGGSWHIVSPGNQILRRGLFEDAYQSRGWPASASCLPTSAQVTPSNPK